MKVLIVAKTRQGPGACIGGITPERGSVRLVPADPTDERWGLAFEIGELWEVQGEPPAALVPPHCETIAVRERRQLKRVPDPAPTIERYMPPRAGGPEVLYDGLARALQSGALYIDHETGVPSFSTAFWRPDRPLVLDETGKPIRYRYGSGEEAVSLVFVGLQDPPPVLPAGSLLRVSLSHWWRPEEHPNSPERCFVQLSGWFEESERARSAGLERAAARTAGAAQAPATGAAAPAASGPAAQPKADLTEARRELARVFGYEEFRPLQESLIGNVLTGRDSLGIMPTGSGKSLCYQLPALLLDGLTVVVSPLLALMQDQVDQLRQSGVAAVTLNSMLSSAEYVAGARLVRSGQAKILYVAPETLLRPETQVLLEQARLACFTVDEAHCISEWGHDFRPEYRQLRPVRKRFPKAVCLALTATATPRVQQDIRQILDIAPENTFLAGFDRPNLFLEVRGRREGFEQVRAFVAGRPEESGIVYCSTRDNVEKIVAYLVQKGIRALPYHAGLPDAERRANQHAFLRDDVPVMVATIAFGMGINKPNVRFVVHHNLPDCLETYYQQIGRAGRDGLRSECLLLYARQDVGTIVHFINEGAPAERPGRTARLAAMVRYADAAGCRRATLLPYFDDAPAEASCGMCDNCLAGESGRMRVDVSAEARLFLQCVEQTRQRFGMTHVIDVLRGSQSARVLKWGHEKLAAHGGGRHRHADDWRLLGDRFVEQGLLEVDMQHGTLRLRADAREVLNGRTVEVLLEVPAPGTGPELGDREYDVVLFELLRSRRKELSDAANLPPYVIFSDRTLREMAVYYPQTAQELLQVHGVGEHKVASYGEPFLELVRAHVTEHGLTPPPREATAPRLQSAAGSRTMEVGEAFRSGCGIEELCRRSGVTENTIIRHLQSFQEAGEALDAERLLAECRLSEEERDRALRCFEEAEGDYLGPVYAALEGAVPYRELHLLRLYRRAMTSRAE